MAILNGRCLTYVANPKNGIIWSKEEQNSKLGAVAEVLVGGHFVLSVWAVLTMMWYFL